MFDRLAGERDGAWILAALRRRWWVMLVTALVAAVAAYFLAQHQAKEYQATGALLFLNSSLDQELTNKPIVDNSTDPIRTAATNQSLVELPTVSGMAAAQLGIPSARVQHEV